MVLTLAVLAVCAVPAPAQAHAIVRSTEPAIDEVVAASPPRVLMQFNEPVEIAFGAVRVFDSNGRRVDQGNAAHVPGSADQVQVELEPRLAEGTYTVSWRIISADSHPISEAHVFHVGAPGVNPEGVLDQVLAGEMGAGRGEAFLLGVTRWINFLALLVLVGALLFLVVVWHRPGSMFARPAEVERRFDARWHALLRWSWATAAVITIIAVWAQGAVAAGVPLATALSPIILWEVLGTRFGVVAVVKLAVLVIGAALWILASHRFAAAWRAPVPRSVGAAPAPPPSPHRWSVAARSSRSCSC